MYAQVCVTTDENGVETKTNLVKSSPSSTSSPSQTSSQFETRAKVNRTQDHLLFKIYVYILTITSTGSFGVYTVKVLGPLLRLCYSHYKVSFFVIIFFLHHCDSIPKNIRFRHVHLLKMAQNPVNLFLGFAMQVWEKSEEEEKIDANRRLSPRAN